MDLVFKSPQLKEHSTFLKIGSFSNSPRVKQLSFTIFQIHSADLRSGGTAFSIA